MSSSPSEKNKRYAKKNVFGITSSLVLLQESEQGKSYSEQYFPLSADDRIFEKYSILIE